MSMYQYLISLLAVLMLSACGSSGGDNSTPPPVEPPPPSEPPPAALELPSYNTDPEAPDITGMESSAAEIAGRMTIGLNIGNTLEAMGGKSETYWGNPAITREFIAFAKESGFNALRLPVSWDQYADPTTAEIEPQWLERVREVVQYSLDEDLYVIVNIHWDGGWLERQVTPAHQAENNAKQKAYWEQIATLLRDFDERVLFASANEPNVDTADEMAVLLSYHQTFIDAVRSTGGKNAYRTLIVQGPYTDIEKTQELMTTLPTDSASERLMVELHYYSPWQFALMEEDEDWGNRFFYWGRDNHSPTDTEHNPTGDEWEEDYVDKMFEQVKIQFVDQGIPVILGEYGAVRRDHLTGDDRERHLRSRAYYFYYVTQSAMANGMVPFYWDTGSLLDRSNDRVLEPLALDGLMDGAQVHPPYWQETD